MSKALGLTIGAFAVLSLGYIGLGAMEKFGGKSETAAVLEEGTVEGLEAVQPVAGALAALEPGVDYGLEVVVAGEANGTITIDLFEDVAPGHVAQIVTLAENGTYDNVVFHRVINGFMAQTGDVKFGKSDAEGFSMQMAGMGGSSFPDLAAEFSEETFDAGVVGMARSQNPNSANSQFFIMFAPAPHLNGQYTVVGKVTGGMDVVHAIKRGDGPNGAVIGEPDTMQSVTVTR